MTSRRPLPPDQCDMNLHAVPRTLRQRAKARAASLGLSLKEWVTSLIERALRDTHGTVKPSAATDTIPVAEESPAPSDRHRSEETGHE